MRKVTVIMFVLIWSLLCFTSCDQIGASDSESDKKREYLSNEYKFDSCVHVEEHLYRCENVEAICYKLSSSYQGGLSCFLKQKIKTL